MLKPIKLYLIVSLVSNILIGALTGRFQINSDEMESIYLHYIKQIWLISNLVLSLFGAALLSQSRRFLWSCVSALISNFFLATVILHFVGALVFFVVAAFNKWVSEVMFWD